MLRLVTIGFIAVAIWVGSLLAVYALVPTGRDDWIAIPVSLLALVFGTWLGFRMLSRRPTYERQKPISELLSEGIAESQEFSALRAFEVEEFEDEGRHFFVELEDKRVLYLCGQYLYDTNEQFPSSDFSVIRNKTEGWVYEVLSKGQPLNVDCVCKHYSKKFIDRYGIPEDGTILGMPYDTLKKEIE